MKQTPLNRLLNFEELQKLFDIYHKATGVSVALYDTEGTEHLAVRNSGCVCGLVKDSPLCREKIVSSGKKSAELKKAYIYETACGLVLCITPVFAEDAAVGYITTGPVCLWGQEDFFEDEFLNRCREVGIDVENEAFHISEIKEVACETMTGLADMLMLMVEHTSEKDRQYRAESAEKERIYAELQQDFASLEQSVEQGGYRKYPVELEKELIAFVRLGDKKGARSIINNLLTEILLYAGGDLNIIKAKLYELMAFFSRTAVEVGAEITDLADIVKKSSGLLLDNIDFQDLCCTTIEILDEYLDIVCQTRGGRAAHSNLIAAISFIRSEYGNCELSLSMTAKKIYVSSYYLSHLFSDEMGITFIDYLTRIRIDHAKTHLLEGLSSEETAKLVGFKDVSYFIKIFKKHVGVTPAKYRKARPFATKGESNEQ